MLWISIRSKGWRRSSAVTLRAAPARKRSVALEVGALAAARLAGGGAVQGDRPRADGDLLVVVEADAVDPVATFGQGPRLALDPRVDDEVGVVDHADPQVAAVAAAGPGLS